MCSASGKKCPIWVSWLPSDISCSIANEYKNWQQCINSLSSFRFKCGTIITNLLFILLNISVWITQNQVKHSARQKNNNYTGCVSFNHDYLGFFLKIFNSIQFIHKRLDVPRLPFVSGHDMSLVITITYHDQRETIAIFMVFLCHDPVPDFNHFLNIRNVLLFRSGYLEMLMNVCLIDSSLCHRNMHMKSTREWGGNEIIIGSMGRITRPLIMFR